MKNLDDLISRQAAKNALLNCGEIMFNPDKEIAAEALDSVPTAGQDAIIHCKDCKWFKQPGCAVYYKDFPEDAPKENDFCSFAERRCDDEGLL